LADYIFHTAFAGTDLTVAGGKLFVAGATAVLGWTSELPSTGAYPDFSLASGSVGTVQFQNLQGVSWDGTWFALSDAGNSQIYVWNGIPNPPRAPDHILATGPTGTSTVGSLSSNGTTLAAVLTFDAKIELFNLTNISATPQYVDGSSINPNAPIRFNLPEGVALSGNKLFVADTVFNRVQIWNDFSAAITGSAADVILGQPDNNINDTNPAIGQNTLFWPGFLSFDGSYLWVGEYKFSGRLLRFSIH